MIYEVAEAARVFAEAKASRDDAIRAARAAGHSLRQIAEAANLTHGTVATITKGAPDGRP